MFPYFPLHYIKPDQYISLVSITTTTVWACLSILFYFIFCLVLVPAKALLKKSSSVPCHWLFMKNFLLHSSLGLCPFGSTFNEAIITWAKLYFYLLKSSKRQHNIFNWTQEKTVHVFKHSGIFFNYRLYQKVVCLFAFPFCMRSNVFLLLKIRFNLWEIFLKYDWKMLTKQGRFQLICGKHFKILQTVLSLHGKITWAVGEGIKVEGMGSRGSSTLVSHNSDV